MKRPTNNAGFSLIELLCVVVIIGIIAAIAIPNLIKARHAAENASAVSLMTIIRNSQATCLTQKGRYGYMDELVQSFGVPAKVQNNLLMERGAFKFELTSDTSQLNVQYTILATRAIDNQIPYIYSLDQSGAITQVAP